MAMFYNSWLMPWRLAIREREFMKPARKMLIAVLVAALIITIILSFTCAREEGLGEQGKNCPVIVNEIMTSNQGVILDPQGNASDYVELYNTGEEAFKLDGFVLSDREDKSWVFPINTVIEGHGYLLVWCTGDKVDNALIADFKLSRGETLRFSDASGHLLFVEEMPEIFSGNSYAYNMDTQKWEQQRPSPGFPNTEEGIAAFAQNREPEKGQASRAHNGVYISEFMASNKTTLKGPDGEAGDWLELYNTSDQPVNLAGCGVSDNPDKPYRFTFPEGTVIEPHGFLLLYQTTTKVDGAHCLNFGLAKNGGEVLLSDPGGMILDRVAYGGQTSDRSMQRPMDGMNFDPNRAFEETGLPSPGFANNEAGWAAYDAQRNPNLGVYDITLSEVLVSGYQWYMGDNNRPQDRFGGEWVELHNKSDAAVDISGYSLSDTAYGAGSWVFPEGTSIAAKGYLVLKLKGGSAPDSNQDYLELNFDIKAGGEPLSLFDREENLIDRAMVPASRAGVSYVKQSDGSWGLTESPTPNAANADSGKKDYCPAPVLSVGSGLYHTPQSLGMEVPAGCYVTYTLDCTTPTEQSTRYQPNTGIPIDKNLVIRARAFAEDGRSLPSDVISNTYVLVQGEATAQSHDTDLNMIFLVTEPGYLFDHNFGMYVLGNGYQGPNPPGDWTIDTRTQTRMKGANFGQRGRSWERETHFTYLAKGGSNVEYETDLMLRIFGAYSRWEKQKGFSLIPRKGYGDANLEYAFFDDRPFTSYDAVILRAGANDYNISKIRDVTIQSLAVDAKVNMATQAFVHCVVYLNGEYWGIYHMREKINRSFISQHYGVNDKNTITIMRGNSELLAGAQADKDDYMAMIKYCEERNFKLDDAAYDYIKSKVDVENFALYCALEIAVGNTDTGNIKWWRSPELDNKWRWLFYDFCWAMNGDNPDQDIATTTGFRRDFFTKYFHVEGHGAGRNFSTVLARSLLSNNQFVEIFLKYCAMMVNEVYSTDAIHAKVDEISANIGAEIAWDFPQWGSTVKGWNSNLNKIRGYADNYPNYFLKYCQDYINKNTNYKLTDEKMIEIFGRKSTL